MSKNTMTTLIKTKTDVRSNSNISFDVKTEVILSIYIGYYKQPMYKTYSDNRIYKKTMLLSAYTSLIKNDRCMKEPMTTETLKKRCICHLIPYESHV